MDRLDPVLDERVRLAARGLGRAGLVHAFGHCSARVDAEKFLVCAPMPMGLIRDEPGTIVSVEGDLPSGVLGEVRAHQAIYRARPDVGGICRIMPPAMDWGLISRPPRRSGTTRGCCAILNPPLGSPRPWEAHQQSSCVPMVRLPLAGT
jgi:hypothetical protein